jgi:ribosome biogenesis protein SSF1/2
MNNFLSPATETPENIPRHLESMTTTVFQSLFPPISPQTTPLSSIRRVLLLNRETSTKPDDEGSYIINLRHYAITTKPAGLSRPLRRLKAAEKLLHSQSSIKNRNGGLPNLGKLEDIADFITGGEGGDGYVTDVTSASEVDTDAEVEILESATKKVLSSKARKLAAKDKISDGTANIIQKKAIKLVELGPRMMLRLTKVEEGVCAGKVMWHEYINKSKAELQEMDRVWEQRRREKEERKMTQRENVERKRKARGLKTKDAENGDDGEDEMDVDDWDSEDFDRDEEMKENGQLDDKDEIAAG